MHDCLNKALIAKQILKHSKLFCRILGNIKINPTHVYVVFLTP